MNKDKMRMEIARACKWKPLQDYGSKISRFICDDDNGYPYSEARFLDEVEWAAHFDVGLPDYLNDLNAMHEAEKVLDANQWETYRKNLAKEWSTNDDDGMWAAINATAEQRAEAFIKTVGKYKTNE